VIVYEFDYIVDIVFRKNNRTGLEEVKNPRFLIKWKNISEPTEIKLSEFVDKNDCLLFLIKEVFEKRHGSRTP